MNKFFKKLGQWVFFFRWPIFLVFCLGTAFFAQAVFYLKIDPSTETLFAKNTEAYKFYREFREEFGSDYLIAIAVKSPDYLTLENLRWTRALTNVLSSDDRVDRIVSLTNAMDIKHKMFGVKVEPVIEGILEGDKPLEEFRNEVLQNPFLEGNLISADGKTGAILIRLKAKGDDPEFLRGYVGELRALLESFPWPGVKFFIAGAPVEQNDFVEAIRRDQFFVIPAVTVFLVLAIFLIYRKIANVIVAMTIVIITLIWTFGTIAALGHSLNLVNSLLAPVVMIVAVQNAIYLINLFSELRCHHPSLRECIGLTLQHLGVPCFLTSSVAAAGFLSLQTNQVPAVQSFGVFAAVGTAYAFGFSMLLMPLLLPFLPRKDPFESDSDKHFFNQAVVFYLEKVEFRFKWPILIATVIALTLSLMGIRNIRVDTNLIHDLPPHSPLAAATHFVDRNLAGVYALGISIERTRPGPLLTEETLKKVDALADFLEEQPEITKVNSLAVIIKKVHEARVGDPTGFVIPDEETLQTYLEKMAESDNPDFWSFVSKDFRRLRLEARMRAVGTQRGRAMEERLWNHIHKQWGPEYDVRVTGNTVLLGKMAEELVMNQLESLGIAFFIILTLISLFFGSWKMGLLASIPNLIPIIALYGVMGFLKIELSTPTAMISSVVLGLVVDAAIQFLYRFRYEFEQRGNYLQALHHTYRNVGQAMVVSTMILIFGFSCSIFASFRPTVYFGLLTGLTIFFALTCTLILLPLVLVLMRPLGPQGLVRRSRKQTLTPSDPSSIIAA